MFSPHADKACNALTVLGRYTDIVATIKSRAIIFRRTEGKGSSTGECATWLKMYQGRHCTTATVMKSVSKPAPSAGLTSSRNDANSQSGRCCFNVDLVSSCSIAFNVNLIS